MVGNNEHSQLYWKACGAVLLLFCTIIWFYFGGDPQWLRQCLVVILFFGPAYEDWKTGWISDGWSAVIGIIGFFHGFFLTDNWNFMWSFAAVVSFFALLYIFSRKALGLGDVFLAPAMALWMVPETAAVFLFFSFTLGAVTSCFLMFIGKKQLTSAVRFGPFLAAGGIVAYGWGTCIWEWYLFLW